VSPLGAGGVGEVCRAVDTKLGRDTHAGYDVIPDGRFSMAETAEALSPAATCQNEIVSVPNFLRNLAAGRPVR